jgi:ATP-dependent Clp protease ATP-binding subunit ClpA
MAAELRDREVQLQAKIKNMEQEWQDTQKKETPIVTKEDIAEVVSMWRHPVSALQRTKRNGCLRWKKLYTRTSLARMRQSLLLPGLSGAHGRV